MDCEIEKLYKCCKISQRWSAKSREFHIQASSRLVLQDQTRRVRSFYNNSECGRLEELAEATMQVQERNNNEHAAGEEK